MRKKYLKFIKNMGFTAAGSVAGGVVGAELTDLLTDSKKIISVGSTISQFIVASGIFLPLHAQDNPDLYRDEKINSFKWKEYIKDMTKIGVGFSVLDCFYIIGRPVVNYYLQKWNYGSTMASFLSDAFCIPAYYITALPIARRLGVIRENENTDKRA